MPLRLLLVGAFPYPHYQGSQVYFREQAIALRAAGAEVELLTYSTRAARAPGDLGFWRGLDGFEHWKTPPWTASRSLRSGPSWGKPIADLGIAMTLDDAIASKMLRSESYDAILTHNAEATLMALAARRLRHSNHTPIVYCVHTLLGNELSSYFKSLNYKNKMIAVDSLDERKPNRSSVLVRVINRLGDALDRTLARRVDGWISLTRSSHRVMRRASIAPGAMIPPGLPDPRHQLEPLLPASGSQRGRLPDKAFYLYSGNLDAYQEIELLRAAARGRGRDLPPIVVASHDRRVLESGRFGDSPITPLHVDSGDEMLALIASARATLVMRQAEGGFPIKLANSLAAGTPPITFLEREWGLTHGENAWVAEGGSPAGALHAAIARLDQEPAIAERLGKGARALYETRHRPESMATETLGLIEAVLSRRSR